MPSRKIRRAAPLGAALALVLAPTAASAAGTLYAMDAGAAGVGTLAQFGLAANGVPTPLVPPSVTTGGQPQHLAVSSDGRFAYASATETGQLFAYAVGDEAR
jgi:hypothetical protein